MLDTVPKPDGESILRHLQFIAAPCPCPELQLELAWGGPEEGPNCARLFPVSHLEAAAAHAALVNQAGCNVYVGITLKKGDACSSRRTGNSAAVIATSVAADIDGDLVAGARKLPQGVRPQLIVITGTTPHTRGHLWFGLQPSADFDLWDEVTRRAIASCDGDMNARGRSRLMRLGGTVSYPSHSKRVRGYVEEPVTVHHVRAPSYTLEDLFSLLSNIPPVWNATSRPTAPTKVRPRTAPDIAVVKSALGVLPRAYAEEHDLWLKTGFSLHSFDAGPHGLALFKQFSEQCPAKAALTDFERKWVSFARTGGQRAITCGWLFAQAKDHGWCGPRLSARRRRRR